MIVFNTTYLVSLEVHDMWLQWISFRYIPAMLATSFFKEPRLFKVMVEEKEGITYSLQFSAQNMEMVRQWQQQYQDEMNNDLRETFGESVVFFSTFLEEIK